MFRNEKNDPSFSLLLFLAGCLFFMVAFHHSDTIQEPGSSDELSSDSRTFPTPSATFIHQLFPELKKSCITNLQPSPAGFYNKCFNRLTVDRNFSLEIKQLQQHFQKVKPFLHIRFYWPAYFVGQPDSPDLS
jgi:hypothetical protein